MYTKWGKGGEEGEGVVQLTVIECFDTELIQLLILLLQCGIFGVGAL